MILHMGKESENELQLHGLNQHSQNADGSNQMCLLSVRGLVCVLSASATKTIKKVTYFNELSEMKKDMNLLKIYGITDIITN
jgi:hypothetical protein